MWFYSSDMHYFAIGRNYRLFCYVQKEKERNERMAEI